MEWLQLLGWTPIGPVICSASVAKEERKQTMHMVTVEISVQNGTIINALQAVVEISNS